MPTRPSSLTAGKTSLIEDSVPAQLDYTPQRFKENAAVHLARAQHAIDKHDGHLLDLEAHAVGGKLHLDLEGVALELDGVEIDGLEHLAAIAHEACRGVTHLHAGNQSHIGRPLPKQITAE